MLVADTISSVETTADASRRPVFLGIDTGGTYTDAVLYCEQDGLLAKAKSLTTRQDLAIGITGAARAVIDASNIPPSRIGLVSMSTTLATNALVEGQGGRVALVMIGFTKRDLERDGLAQALGTDPVIFCPGGHDVHGNSSELDLRPLEAVLPQLAGQVSGVALAAYFAVRNPAHELAARELVAKTTALPVTCSHELSSRLGGPRRALTTLLNARLISMITRLIDSTESFMAANDITAPLMVVRGDGALVSSGLARQRPIETILSGPAASLVGARHLTGIDNAIVSDIGGTTTDIAVLEGGNPRLDPDGATVGGFRTMVEAVAMRTYGLGGDSEVSVEEGALQPRIFLGPRRLIPLALAGASHGELVHEVLERQLRAPNTGRLDGRLVMRTGLPDSYSTGLAPSERKIFDLIDASPAALDRIVTSTMQNSTLLRLLNRGLVQIIGFTPSDAAHVLGRQDNWDRHAAELGAELFARRRNGRGLPIAASGEAISLRVLETITRRSAEVIIETALVEDGLDGPALMVSPLVSRAMGGQQGIARTTITLDRPVIGLGASSPVHYAGLSRLTGTECIVPADTDVANALGAVAGQVRVAVEARITRPREDLYRVAAGDTVSDYRSEAEALARAEETAFELAGRRAAASGTDMAEIAISRDIRAVTVEGQRMFIEASIVATASGRPRITNSSL